MTCTAVIFYALISDTTAPRDLVSIFTTGRNALSIPKEVPAWFFGIATPIWLYSGAILSS